MREGGKAEGKREIAGILCLKFIDCCLEIEASGVGREVGM